MCTQCEETRRLCEAVIKWAKHAYEWEGFWEDMCWEPKSKFDKNGKKLRDFIKQLEQPEKRKQKGFLNSLFGRGEQRKEQEDTTSKLKDIIKQHKETNQKLMRTNQKLMRTNQKLMCTNQKLITNQL